MAPPPRRSNADRRSTNVKRRLQEPALGEAALSELAQIIQYEPYAKHKRQPRAFGLDPIPGVSEDATFCDEHAGFTPADMERIPWLLERGVMAGLTSDSMASGVPRLVWTVDDNGWVYEARLTNVGGALYHGYPLLPGDVVATQVLGRFTRWAYDAPSEMLKRCRDMTREHAIAVARTAEELYGG